MMHTTRRTLLKAGLLGSAALGAPWLRAQTPPAGAKLPKLLLAGPSASVSNALIHIVDAGLLNDVAEQVAEEQGKSDTVLFSQRVTPLIHLLELSLAEGKGVVWGV